MEVKVHQSDRIAGDHRMRALAVTSDGRYCDFRFDLDTGHVGSFGGDVWPGDLPTVFIRGPVSAQCPVNVSLVPEIVEHFRGSTASYKA